MTISTIASRTRGGRSKLGQQRVASPVSTEQIATIARLAGGKSYSATNISELN
ncbi:hypothetical protein ABFA25_06965 [Mycobacterium lepromatosis]|nr:hypothetical protein [Mycobacterium lepromatosis]